MRDYPKNINSSVITQGPGAKGCLDYSTGIQHELQK